MQKLSPVASEFSFDVPEKEGPVEHKPTVYLDALLTERGMLWQVFQRQAEYIDGVYPTDGVPTGNLRLSHSAHCCQVDCIRRQHVIVCSKPAYW